MVTLLVTMLQSRGRWRFLAAGWLLVAALALSGLRAHPDAGGVHRTFWDDVYNLPDFYSFSVGLEVANLDWRLQAARWIGPMIAALSLLELIAVVSRNGFTRFRTRRLRGHTVVCGAGERGARIATALAATGRRVVVVESRREASAVAALRARDVLVVEGDARAPETLRAAGAAAAAEVVVCAGADATNAEVAGAVAGLPRAAGAPGLRCVVHLSDAALCALLRHQTLRTARDGLRFEFFDVYSAGARMLLERHPLAAAAAGRPVHLVVVGVGQFGRAVVEAAARATTLAPDAPRPRVTLVDRGAAARLEAILLGQPELRGHLDLRAVDIDTDRPEASAADAFREVVARGEVTTVVVAFDDDARAVSAGLLVRRLLGGRRAEVIVRLAGASGLGTLVAGGAEGVGITGFPFLDRACTAAVVEGGVHEQVARAIHADYTERAEDTPYDVPWEDLPAEVRESNRRAADALAAGLGEIGCDLVPLGGWGADHVAFTRPELDALARREHERWMAERRAAGWTHGPVRDAAARTNPLLVEWDDLPEEARADARAAAARIPEILARAGLEVIRLAPAAVSEPAPASGAA